MTSARCLITIMIKDNRPTQAGLRIRIQVFWSDTSQLSEKIGSGYSVDMGPNVIFYGSLFWRSDPANLKLDLQNVNSKYTLCLILIKAS